MKKTNKILISVLALGLLITACTTAKVTPANPTTGAPASTNYVVNPKLTSTLDTVGSVVDVTAPVDPYAGLIKLGLGAIAAGATWFAARKNSQAAQSALLTKTVIQGVEASGNADVKAAIEKHATLVGVQGALSDAVYTVTK